MIRVEDFDNAEPSTREIVIDTDTVERLLKVAERTTDHAEGWKRTYDAMVENYEARLKIETSANDKWVAFIIVFVLAVTWTAGFLIGHMV